MQTLHVAVAKPYPIHIGQRLLADVPFWQSLLQGRQAFLLSDDNVAPLHAPALRSALAGADLAELIIPHGEEQKSLANFSAVMDALIASRRRRNAVMIALGGGVIGDLAGFAAACYQRGMPVIQVPTTLLAQVDSSVGGKTAINHPAGKNMIGAFHQPETVVVDLDTLHTLPAREFSAGMAEVIKYGLLAEDGFLDWLEQHSAAILEKDTATLTRLIAHSCAAKAQVVAVDPDEKGLRAILNLGHTFGHALETELGYGVWLHGEAVAWGMVCACELALRTGHLTDRRLPERLRRLLAAFSLPLAHPRSADSDKLIAHMRLDKKNIDAGIRFILPLATGRVAIVNDVAVADVRATLEALPRI